MKKILPYIPLFVLVVGVMTVQLGGDSSQGLMSSALPHTSFQNEGVSSYCSKPSDFVSKDETAWCHKSLFQNIQKQKNTWTWQCKNGEELQKCTFAETKNYPVRGGTYFSQK